LFVALRRQRRPIPLGQAQILFVQVQREKFFGIQETSYHDSFFNVSDREKTLLDCLDRFDLCGGVDEVAQTIAALLPEADAGRLLAYLPRMGNQALIHRLGYILEQLSTRQSVAKTLLDGLASMVSRRVYPLDPHGPAGGVTHPRWRVRENIQI
jgi:predicted transcriptional regulator of viral defense system